MYLPVKAWPDPYDPAVESLEPAPRPEHTVFIITTFQGIDADQYKERQEELISKLLFFYHAYGLRAEFNFLRIDPSRWKDTSFHDRVTGFVRMIDTADLVIIDSGLTTKFHYDLRMLILYTQKHHIPYLWIDPTAFVIWEGSLLDFEPSLAEEDGSAVQEYIINTEEVTKEELHDYERETEEEW